MEEILQQIPVTPQQDSERPNSASFRLLHLTSSSMEFTESDYLPHELNTGGFCICLRGKSRVTLNQHRCYIQKGDLCVFFPRMLMQLDDHSDDFEAYCIVSEIDVTREVQVPSATSLFLYIKDHPRISLDDTTFRRMLKYCRMFSEFERNGHPYRDQITLHMSMMLYYEIFHIYQHGKPLAMSAQTRQESMFREFLFLVSQHYSPRARNRVLRRPDLRDAQIPLVGSTDRIGQQRGVVDQPHGHHAREKSAQNQSPAHHSADLRQTQFPQSVVLRPVFQTPRGNDAQRVPPQSLLTAAPHLPPAFMRIPTKKESRTNPIRPALPSQAARYFSFTQRTELP